MEATITNGTHETLKQTNQPAALRLSAKFLSYILHPLFIPTYIFFWLVWRFPTEFAGITPLTMFTRKFGVFWMSAFFPAFSIFLMWRLKFIDNMYLRTQKERIAPYMITMIFYWWLWYLSRNFTDQPEVLRFFYFGIMLNTVVGLTANNFFKISMHAMGAGSAVTFVILTALYYQVYIGPDIIITILLAGIICTARLLLSEHNNYEIYTGLFVGVFCQILSKWFIM